MLNIRGNLSVRLGPILVNQKRNILAHISKESRSRTDFGHSGDVVQKLFLQRLVLLSVLPSFSDKLLQERACHLSPMGRNCLFPDSYQHMFQV